MIKEENNWKIIGEILFSIWKYISSLPWIVVVITSIGAFLLDLWLNLYVGLIVIVLAAIVDTNCAINACKKKGGKFQSPLIKKGLSNKLKLYSVLTFLGVAMDLLFRKIYDYDKFFVAFLFFAYILLYEAGSIAEKLAVTNPNNPLIARLSRFLNLADKKLDDKLEDKLK